MEEISYEIMLGLKDVSKSFSIFTPPVRKEWCIIQSCSQEILSMNELKAQILIMTISA